MNEFRHCDMSGSVFDDVNLGGATFYNVNLAEATIRNANLSGLKIEGAGITGMTIFGFDVGALIEAELDRRDPERLRLKVGDFYDVNGVRQVMERLEVLRAEFRLQLSSVAPSGLRARPAPEKWSPIEHVRHLVFVEQLYVDRFVLQNDAPWHPLGLLPTFMMGWKGFEGVGNDESTDLDTVLAAWAEVHEGTRTLVEGLTSERLRQEAHNLEGKTQPVGQVLQNLARHDLHHIRLVQETLGAN